MGRRRTRSLAVVEHAHFRAWRNAFICQRKAASTIQRYWAVFANIDPVTLDRISSAFLLFRKPRMLRFDANALNAYIRSSGDFCDPIARCEYAPHELMRLDRICNNNESIFNARDRLLRQREDSLVHQSILTALESELFSSINDAVELSSLPHVCHLSTTAYCVAL